jgi:hypothetical protein
MTGSHLTNNIAPYAVYPSHFFFNEEHYDTIVGHIKTADYVTTKKQTSFVRVPRDLATARKLAALGYDAPSPMLETYDWPGRFTPYAHQAVTAGFFTLHHRAFCFNGLGCVDADTEYLSPTGWKRIADYAGGQVAQFDNDTGRAEFVDPVEFVKLPCDTMVHFKNKYGVDQLLSLEHRMLVVDHKAANVGRMKRAVMQAAEVLADGVAWAGGRVLPRGGKRGGTPTVSYKSAAIPTVFDAPRTEGVGTSDALLRLQIAVIADGHFPGGTNHCVVRLKRPRKIARMHALLEAADVKYSARRLDCPSASGYSVFKFYAPRHDKEFGAWWWGCSPAQLAVVADEVLHWDGSQIGKRRAFSTTVAASADFVQYAFSATGRTARLVARERADKGHTEYTVTVSDRQHVGLAGTKSDGTRLLNAKLVPSPDGFKYCFMVPSTFLVLRRNGCVFVTGNTGKSASALWAWDYLRREGLAGRLLILCPLSCVEAVWARECFNIVPSAPVGIMTGSKKKRLAALESDAPILIMNHDGLRTITKELEQDDTITHIICDEATAYKNYRAEVTKSLRTMLKDRSCWMMTGTPIAQSPEDAWSLGRIISPHLMPPSLGQYRDKVCNAKQIHLGARKVTKYEPKKEDEVRDYVFSLLQPAVRFAKEDCVDLPPVHYVDYFAPLSTEQDEAVKQITKQWLFEDAQSGSVIAAETAAARVSKLNQIYQGAAIGEGGVVEFDFTPRFELLCELIDGSQSKTIVFATYTATIERLERELSQRYDVVKIDGSTTSSQRGDIVKRFQAPGGPRVLIAHPKTASHGLTLTAASTTVWFGVYFSAEGYEQANNRMDRPGQVNNMLIANIYSGAAELKGYQGVQAKQKLQALLLGMYSEETTRIAGIKTRRKK